MPVGAHQPLRAGAEPQAPRGVGPLMPTDSRPTSPPRDAQRARLVARFGRRARLAASVDVTSRGLVAIGALVSAILLSTAVLVRAAVGARGSR
jgi:hypothetical protein